MRNRGEEGYYSADATLMLRQRLEEATSTAAKGAGMYVVCEGTRRGEIERVCGEKVEGADKMGSTGL